MNRFFQTKLETSDPIIADAVRSECRRQQNQIELIASENVVSPAVLRAQGTVFTNKYAEGYPGRRYYGGCEYADVVESTAIERVNQLFGSKFANVQPHSGAQANGTAFLALLKPGDTFLGLSLDAGGHLTHGAKPTLSGKWFNAVSYGVRPDDALIDFDQVLTLAEAHKPKLIIAGGSAYPRSLDFKKFREIADDVGALLMVDMAHIAGLVAGGAHANPLEYAHIVTSTTHKTLRGPRGGIILTNDAMLAKKIDSAVFPGMQGGPLMHVIAAKAVAFGEALQPEFKVYAHQMVANARALAASLRGRGFDLVAGGTDTHLLLVDLRSKNLTGDIAEQSLERAHLTCNKNGIPFDPQKPSVTSGIRLGSAVGTTRGFREPEFELVGSLIADVLDGLASGSNSNGRIEERARKDAMDLCEIPNLQPREREMTLDSGFREKIKKAKMQAAALFKAAPEPMRAFGSLMAAASKDGALDARTKELMALAIAIVSRCEGCLLHHVETAMRHGAERQHIIETIAVSVEMGGGPATVYGATALAAFDELSSTAS